MGSCMNHWTLMVKKKEGELVSKLKLNKLKKESRLGGNNENKSLTECNNEWLKVLEIWRNFKEEKTKMRENKILERHSVELPEGDENER